MALNPASVGHTTEPLTFKYRWQDAALYNLGVGAKIDELDYLYERRGPKVVPTFGVIPSYEACKVMFDVIAGNFAGVVHGSQTVRWHKPFAAEGTLKTVGKVAGIYDLRRMAQGVMTTETRDEAGDLLFEAEWTIMYLLDGGFGGEAPPKSVKIHAPDRAPDWEVAEKTTPEQGALYRLSGDYNPLHIDPVAAQFAEKVTQGKPILHGLCTYGHVARALLKNECGGDESKLKLLSGRFSRPVWPGDTIVTKGWREEGRVIVVAGTLENPDEPVFANAWAEVG